MTERYKVIPHSELEIKSRNSEWRGFRPLQIDFLIVSIKSGLFSQLDQRTKTLIITRAVTGNTLESLKPLAGVTSRERVRQIIVKGLHTIHSRMPEEQKAQYRLEEILSLGSRPISTATLARMSATRKGRTHSAEARAKMSAERKRWWAEKRSTNTVKSST